MRVSNAVDVIVVDQVRAGGSKTVDGQVFLLLNTTTMLSLELKLNLFRTSLIEIKS